MFSRHGFSDHGFTADVDAGRLVLEQLQAFVIFQHDVVWAVRNGDRGALGRGRAQDVGRRHISVLVFVEDLACAGDDAEVVSCVCEICRELAMGLYIGGCKFHVRDFAFLQVYACLVFLERIIFCEICPSGYGLHKPRLLVLVIITGHDVDAVLPGRGHVHALIAYLELCDRQVMGAGDRFLLHGKAVHRVHDVPDAVIQVLEQRVSETVSSGGFHVLICEMLSVQGELPGQEILLILEPVLSIGVEMTGIIGKLFFRRDHGIRVVLGQVHGVPFGSDGSGRIGVLQFHVVPHVGHGDFTVIPVGALDQNGVDPQLIEHGFERPCIALAHALLPHQDPIGAAQMGCVAGLFGVPLETGVFQAVRRVVYDLVMDDAYLFRIGFRFCGLICDPFHARIELGLRRVHLGSVGEAVDQVGRVPSGSQVQVGGSCRIPCHPDVQFGEVHIERFRMVRIKGVPCRGHRLVQCGGVLGQHLAGFGGKISILPEVVVSSPCLQQVRLIHAVDAVVDGLRRVGQLSIMEAVHFRDGRLCLCGQRRNHSNGGGEAHEQCQRSRQ